MRTMNWLLALAAVAAMATGCTEETKTPATTTDTATGSDTATGGDVAMGNDATTTAAAKGCTSAGDQEYLGKVGADKTLEAKFTDDVKNCTLANAAKPDEASASAAIGACVVGKGHTISEVCGGCYGIRGYCTFVKCVKDPAEAATANCVADPGGATCTACANKYDCIKKSDDCKAGK